MATQPTPSRPNQRSAAVIGLQWGDEGKGKIVDILTPSFDAVVRFNGGANAGHTVIIEGQRYALHLIPAGILTPNKKAVIGNGVVVDPEALLHELDTLASKNVDTSNLVVSSRAHAVLPYHKDEDELRERILAGLANDEPFPNASAPIKPSDRSLGTTRRGIGPAYADKHHRATAIRIGDLLNHELLRSRLELACSIKSRTLPRLTSVPHEGLHTHFDPQRLFEKAASWGERLRPYIQDSVYLLHDMLRNDATLLFEGANATLLDIDHGGFPYVTSSSCSSLGIGPGSGVSERHLSRVVGVAKAYSTRVGAGPLPTEQRNPIGDRIRERGREFGTTTGRPRRTGWLDLVAVKYSVMVSSATEVALTLLDVLAGFDSLQVCTHYTIDGETTDRFLPDAYALTHAQPVYESLPGFPELDSKAIRSRAQLPDNARRYVDFVENYLALPVSIISIGPDRLQTLLS